MGNNNFFRFTIFNFYCKMNVGDLKMDFLNILTESNISDFEWCAPGSGLVTVFKIVKIVLNAIRLIVPIGLIVMTVLDISKNVINPDEKDSMKKIGNRLIAAVIVFLVPTMVNIIMRLVDVALGAGTVDNNNNSLVDCWTNAK